MFFILLTNEDSYPGADYDIYEMPQFELKDLDNIETCLLYTSPSPRDLG